MKTFSILVFLAIISMVFLNFINISYYIKNNGSPGGNTGAPGEWGGRTCANPACHSGTAIFQTGMISSDIPAAGYIPGNTYIISGTVSEFGRSKYGFEISPQDSAGNLLGSLNITNSVETKFTNQGKSITHTSSGNTGAGATKTWSFNWTAPNDGTDIVTFWGAFNAANGDNTNSGDIIYRSLLTVELDSGQISANHFNEKPKVFVYPNPFLDHITIRNDENLNHRGIVTIQNTEGITMLKKRIPHGLKKIKLDLSELRSGNYIITYSNSTGQLLFTKRIVKVNPNLY
ncbi:T9SS type A sorting domain-containing protein [Hyphobacterium sp. CCMP332]|nr:T9SS type A sorting domain-containing protein [Hyphobacterium sp. CCMP332]